MKKVHKKKSKKIPIEKIEEIALKGDDVNEFFSGGKMKPSLADKVQRVNVDFGTYTLQGLDDIAAELNISRQAVIKFFIQRELDQHYLARKARKEAS
ncbi:MAG: hypothetical protein KA436_07560 [Oligoflexales bacterium]|nr:hypothetical protein [Oligoflexales bacterium]